MEFFTFCISASASSVSCPLLGDVTSSFLVALAAVTGSVAADTCDALSRVATVFRYVNAAALIESGEDQQAALSLRSRLTEVVRDAE